MASPDLPLESRPTRKAATKAALAIRSDALDSPEDYKIETSAFEAMMSRRPRAKDTAPVTSKTEKRQSVRTKKATPTTPVNDSLDNITGTEVLLPDLEDLVADAGKKVRDGCHHQSYHHFCTESGRKKVQDNLLAWFDVACRKLPWRRNYNDPVIEDEPAGQRAYAVWVSEIMCQQTQVATVIPYYNTWMAKWPTIADLAAADLEDVNKVWTGLGYYSRASRLHQGAQKVLKVYNGVLPSDPVVLEKEIPGVGRYTAGAIASQAYNVPAELVDGNVIRVLSRLRAIGGDVKSPKVIDLHWQIAKELVHQERPGCFNQGLMELGATVCTPQNPKCGECPIQSSCRAFAEMVNSKRRNREAIGASRKRKPTAGEDDMNSDHDQDDICTLCLPETEVEGKDQGLVTQYPRKAIKKAPRDEECAVSILERVGVKDEAGTQQSHYLLVKRPEKGLLAGMWEFPTVEQDQLHKEQRQTQGDLKAVYEPSTYQQRSEASKKYMVETLGLDWIETNKTLERRDLGSAQHLFSHIRKVYHTEWVSVKDLPMDTQDAKGFKTKGGLEFQWLSAQELALAAVPTGINKTFQLLENYKAEGHGPVPAKRQKTAAAARTAKVKNEKGSSDDISRFFKAPKA